MNHVSFSELNESVNVQSIIATEPVSESSTMMPLSDLELEEVSGGWCIGFGCSCNGTDGD